MKCMNKDCKVFDIMETNNCANMYDISLCGARYIEPVEEVSIKQLTIDELREQFESDPYYCAYDKSKDESGEYDAWDTLACFNGYYSCAKNNNLIKINKV